MRAPCVYFVDLTDLYSAVAHDVPNDRSVSPRVSLNSGPMYETPAEIGMVAAMGGTLVGMSTALEAIVARSLGMEILGCHW